MVNRNLEKNYQIKLEVHTMRALFISAILATLPLSAMAESESNQFPSCSMPVVEYTTGEIGEITEHLFSDSVEWVIQSYHRSNSGLPGQFDGWIVIIKMITDGDEDLDDFTMESEGLAQVKYEGNWTLQSEFEYSLCNMMS